MSNALNWFEIPVTDLARANRFYGALLRSELQQETINDVTMAVLPYEQGGVGGALVRSENVAPSAEGTVVYLDAGDDLDGALERVKTAGGKVVMGRTHLSDAIGSIAFFVDTEGNRVGLHSRPQNLQ
ncbi:MAG TPA: VOC family protein [Thermoanaerobaculia bacterium]|nr:VOC family protein [Thermoanaerobaculia bacterium]